MKRTFAALAALAPALALAQATAWNIDPAHTQTGFTVRHLGITNVRGEFKDTTGTVKLDDKDPSRSSLEVTIDAATINTREDKRDAHLRSADFLDVEKHPKITFRSTKVEKKGDGYEVTGDLTLHGVTKPVVLEVGALSPELKDPWGNIRRGVSARTSINRRDFGLQYGKLVEAVPVVGDLVKIEIEAELMRPASGPGQKQAEGKPAVKVQPTIAK
jgi:polyisoprenoid-binding protein YceI